MSNFEAALANFARGGGAHKQKRIEKTMELFGRSRAEATIMDEAVNQAIINAFGAVGKELDSLSPYLQADTMPQLLNIFAENAAELPIAVMSVVFGASEPTPGCDCDACGYVKQLQDELNGVELAANGGGGSVLH